MTVQQHLTRPDPRHVPEGAWPPHRAETDLIVNLDLRLGGRYVTAECQLGAHHACPGGFRTETQLLVEEMLCQCTADGCACNPTTASL
ncbi:hypothetical protein [Kitasatospora sp. NPDC059571]|uniref:hypothetical protein n=1 Tax=Kitasatospora sp. NPDC059571 TaxID=3346871 RepID=UPI0036ACBF7F